MHPTINDAFDLPRPQDIRAMGFVVKLREADPSSDEVAGLVRDYVVTPVVERELPRILSDLKQVYERGEEYGRFVHGSFGSGKSHFLTMLSLLLENAGPAWNRFRTLLDTDHQTWLEHAKLLVVRIHMLSVKGRHTSLDRAIYEGFNQALKKRGKVPFEFLNVESIFEEVRHEAAEYGDIVWKKLETAGIVGGRSDFEALAAGNPKQRESFARSWLTYKGRSAADAGIDPRWAEGLRRMAEHAKAQGFGGIVLMLDEFLLWLAEKSGTEFVSEINSLNVIVDHNTGQRSAPIFVFVARQRNLQEFFPDLVDEGKIHEHLDHHAKRFEITKLQDVELRHIVKGRVLRPKDTDAVQKAVASLSERHQKVLPALLASADIDYLRDVYPFHPALIEMLVDVTSLMQRERSALRLLYELLVLHYPTLPLGEFLPVGSAFAAIFPESGVEASKKVELMQDIHQQYYTRLAPAMRAMADDPATDFNEERRHALDQFVKTVLLAEVSPRLKQSGLTIERLVQLNAADVEGETFRGQVRVTETDLLALSQRVPDLQIAGTGKTAYVRFVLGRVSLGEVLARARSKVDNVSQRFKVFWPALKKALNITGAKGFEEGATEGDYDLSNWRRTRRRGRLKLGNIREMSTEDFETPPGTFKILIDYPWDESGHSVDEDRQRALNARKKLGNRYTTCWLPRHFTPTELSVLTEVAAVRYLLSSTGQDELLDTHSPQDRAKIIEQAGVRIKTLEAQLDELLLDVYKRHGELISLISDVDTSRPHDTLAANLDHIATLLMDRRYPQHPLFGAEPKKADLELLLEWMVRAGDANVSVMYDDVTGKALKTLGQPLELVNLGQTKAALRLDSRYIKDVLASVAHDSVLWTPIAEHMRETYGLQPAIIDLFLCFLCRRDHRALQEGSNEPLTPQIGLAPTTKIRLQRGKVTGGAEWGRLRDLGHELFSIARPPAQCSLQTQDRFAAEMQQKGRDKREVLQGLHSRIVEMGVEHGPRLDQVATAIKRLKPLAQKTSDSFKVLADLLAEWPDVASDPLRAVVSQAEIVREALGNISDDARSHLKGGIHHPEVGVEVKDHLATLEQRLTAAQVEQPITATWALAWTRDAQGLIKRLIQAKPQPVEVPQPPIVPPSKPVASAILLTDHVNAGNSEAIEAFLNEARKALSKQGARNVRLSLVCEEVVE